MARHFLFALLCLIDTGAAQLTTIPEIEGPRAAYQRALADIRAERDKLAATTTRTYAERLADLQTRLTDEGDTQAAAAVHIEMDRMAKGIEPTNEERRKMTGLLLALRVAYEKARGPAFIAAAKKEEQAHVAWATGLGQLEAHLTGLKQLEKVAVVKAERAKVDQATAVAKAVATTPLPAATAGPKLDAALAEKIKTAIAEKRILKTEVAGNRAGPANVPEDGALLIGFELSEFKWKGLSVKALDPIFLTAEGIFRGAMRGKHSKQRTVVQAPDGYAVGALNVYTHDRMQGLQMIFMKLDPATGRLDPKSFYETKWYGTKGEGEPVKLGGDGRLVIGVHGAYGNAAPVIGLVMMP